MFQAYILNARIVGNNATSATMQTFLGPTIKILVVLASLTCTFFLVYGGIHYITSSGRPEKLNQAKKIVRNALVGLVLVISASVFTSVLIHTYNPSDTSVQNNLPKLEAVETDTSNNGVVDLLIKTIVGLFQNVIQTAAAPFLRALEFFTSKTPLMTENTGVIKVWLGIVGIADALLVLVIILIGFHVMSFSSLGMQEISIRNVIPQVIFTFLSINSSIFAIDAIIGLSNGMISALESSFSSSSVWDTLTNISKDTNGLSLVALLIMVGFLVLVVMLLIYYVTRIVILYLGAVLSPLIILLWLIPSFRDFAVAAFRTYLTTIFVLFVHVVILLLAASIFEGMRTNNADGLDPIMSMIVGVATVLILIKTQAVLNQLSYVSIGPKSFRKLGNMFINSASHMTTKIGSELSAK